MMFIGFTFLALLLFDKAGSAGTFLGAKLIGSVLLFVALAGVMFATRIADWGSVGKKEVAA